MSTRAMILKIAHENTAYERKTWPLLAKDATYAEHFAICLRAAWRDYRLGKTALSYSQRITEIDNEIYWLQQRDTLRQSEQQRIAALYAERETLAA